MGESKLRKCAACNEYTMKETHHGQRTVSAHPMRYSKITAEYSKYRVDLKELKGQGNKKDEDETKKE